MKTRGVIISLCLLSLFVASQSSAQTAMDMMGAASVNDSLHGQQAGSVNGARAAEMTKKATQGRETYYDSRSNKRADDRRDPNEFTEEELKILREPSKKSGSN